MHLNLRKYICFLLKGKLFPFMLTAEVAINFCFVVQIFLIGKGAKTAIITLPHLLLGILFIGFGLGVLIT